MDWQPVIDPTRWSVERDGPRGRVPIVGRHSRPEARFWPDAFGDLLRVYPVSDTLDVKLLGVPPGLLRSFSGHRPSNWTLYDFDSVAPERFLAQVNTGSTGKFLVALRQSAAARREHPFGPVVLTVRAKGLALVRREAAAGKRDVRMVAEPAKPIALGSPVRRPRP